MSKPRVVLCPYGSAGDVYPFLWLGRALKRRGYSVVLVTSPFFSDAAREAGIRLAPIGTVADYHAVANDPKLWDANFGPWRVLGTVRGRFDEMARVIGRMADHPRSTIFASAPNFPAWFTARRLGRPLVTVHLQPVVLFSVEKSPLFMKDFAWFSQAPKWFKKAALRLPSPADIILGKMIRKRCEGAGIKKPGRLMMDWWNSPDGVLCFFPEWFAEPQSDWPQNLLQTGFPVFDTVDPNGSLDDELEVFLRAGPPPLVFTAGSAMRFGERFFQSATEAAQRLEKRAVLVAVYDEQIPRELPAGILHTRYAPFSRLFPRAAGVAHHGGIGTLAAGLAAGLPQVVVPMSHDQPDNAARLERLGVGKTVDSRRVSGASMAKAFRSLLENPETSVRTQRCRDWIERDSRDPFSEKFWDFIEATTGESEPGRLREGDSSRHPSGGSISVS